MRSVLGIAKRAMHKIPLTRPLLHFMRIECPDEKNSKKTFKSPIEAVGWLARREEGKPPVRFYLNGRPISIKRLKQLAGPGEADESQQQEDGGGGQDDF